jgi:hypothetical protein
VRIDKADYLMACTWEDILMEDQQQEIVTPAMGSSPQTTEQIITQSPAQTSIFPAASVSRPVVFRNRGIRLFLYNNPKIHPGSIQIVWQGYIAAGEGASAERKMALIRTLLGYLGQEQHGQVDLTQ